MEYYPERFKLQPPITSYISLDSGCCLIYFKDVMKRYDVIIVGTGPSGIFAAWELISSNSGIKILMLDKGGSLSERVEKTKEGVHRAKTEEPDVISCGWGGAGAFSDGKLNLSPEVGGFLKEYIDGKTLLSLIEYVDKIYLKFGAPDELHGTEINQIKDLEDEALRYGLRFIPFPIRHLGTDRCIPVLGGFLASLKDNVEFRPHTEVEEVLFNETPMPLRGTKEDENPSPLPSPFRGEGWAGDGLEVKGVRTGSGEDIQGDFVIVAPGRSGAQWLEKESRRLGLTTLTNPVDIGVRIEAPAPVMKNLTDVAYEAKLVFYSKQFDDQVRTFCMNPYGEVVREYHGDLCLVNGHSYSTKRSNNTNFAILVSTVFTEPFREPIAYGRYIARLANLLGGEIIVQRLGDLLQGRRSTTERIKRGTVRPTLIDATPGDLSFVIPYRYVCDIIEMLQAMDNLTPGLYARDTLLYGVEAKFYSMRLKLTSFFETGIRNLFAIGDGAGITRGLIQASVSGVVAAREILQRI